MRPVRQSTAVTAQIGRLADQVDLVTFDVFDTLIRRPIMPPERSQVPAVRFLVSRLAQRGLAISYDRVAAARSEAGRILCHKAVSAGLDSETHITEWIREWLRLILDSNECEALAADVLRVEVDAEKALCNPAEQMIDAVRMAKRDGRKVVYVSDMYLGKSVIDELLTQCGFGELFDDGFVSGDYKLTKASGRLLQRVLDATGVSCRRWLHIGDNLTSDIRQTQRLGGRAIWYLPKHQESRVKRSMRLAELAMRHPYWQGALAHEELWAQGHPNYGSGSAAWLGYGVLGPALVNFVHRVIDRIATQQVDLVLFPARDGFLLNELFLRLAPHVRPELSVRTEYVYLTRATVFPASVADCGDRELLLATTASSEPVTVERFLRRLGLNPGDLVEILPAWGVPAEAALAQPANPEIVARIVRHPEFRALVKNNAEQHKSLVAEYLRQVGFWGSHRVALVDIGWMGTVQDCLTRAFCDNLDWPTMHGIYMGFLHPHHLHSTPTSNYEGLFCHLGKSAGDVHSLPRFMQLFEFACRAPHASAIGLRRDESTSRIVPILKSEAAVSRQKELRDRDTLVSLQSGILKFCDQYAAMNPYLSETSDRLTPYILTQVDRLIRFPTPREAATLSVHNAEDFGIDLASDMRGPPLRLRQMRAWFREVFANALWKEGALAASGWPGLVHTYQLYLAAIGRL